MPADLDIGVVEGPDATVISVGGEIDMSTCEELRSAVAPHAGRGAAIALDLAGVTFIDSSAIRVMIETRASAIAAGGSFVVRNPSDPVRRVLTVAGVLDLFTGSDAAA